MKPVVGVMIDCAHALRFAVSVLRLEQKKLDLHEKQNEFLFLIIIQSNKF